MMPHKTMQAYQEVFLTDGHKKATRFFIIPVAGKQREARRRLNEQISNYIYHCPSPYSLFEDIANHFQFMIVEGLDD